MARTRYPGITEHRRADGSKFYRVEVWHKGKRLPRSNHDSLTEARRRVVELEDGADQPPPEKGSQLFRDAMETWLTTYPQDPETVAGYRYKLKPILAAIGDKPLREVTRQDLVTIVADLAPRKGTSIRVAVRPVKGVFDEAISNGELAATPYVNIRYPTDTRRPVVPFTHEEVDAIIEQAQRMTRAFPYMPGAVAAGVGLGTRVAETFALRRSNFLGIGNVVSMRGTRGPEVHIDAQLARSRTALDERLREPKTSARTVPLSETTLAALEPYLTTTKPLGLLFVLRNGGPVGRGSYEYAFRKLRRAIGLPEDKSWHDLRDYYASSLLEANVPITSVQRWLGHTLPSITLDHYGHLMAGTEGRGRQAIDGARRGGESGGRGETGGSFGV